MLVFSEQMYQALRFGVVGLTSNLVLYLIYLMLAGLGVDPKIVVTLIYALGLSITFTFNKRWSFSHHGDLKSALVRYLILYGFLYLTNIFMLWLFVDWLEFSDAFVQGGVVVLFIPIVFLMQRYWVFPNRTSVCSNT